MTTRLMAGKVFGWGKPLYIYCYAHTIGKGLVWRSCWALLLYSRCAVPAAGCPNYIQRGILQCSLHALLTANTLIKQVIRSWSTLTCPPLIQNLQSITESVIALNRCLHRLWGFVYWPVGCFVSHLPQFEAQCLFIHRLPKCSSLGDLQAFSCL